MFLPFFPRNLKRNLKANLERNLKANLNRKFNSLNKFTDEEEMIRETGNKTKESLCNNSHVVKRFAIDVIAPKVKEMDESEQMDPKIISSLFENGVQKKQL